MLGRQNLSGGHGGCSNAGRFNQNGRGGGRGGYNRSTNYNKSYNNLKGACEELKDNVYTLGDAKQADRYTKTTEAIVNYIQRTFDKGQDAKDALVALQQTDTDQWMPENNDTRENQLTYQEKLLLQLKMKEYMTRIEKYNDNMNKVYGLILGQCTQGVKNKLEARQDWETMEQEHNPINAKSN